MDKEKLAKAIELDELIKIEQEVVDDITNHKPRYVVFDGDVRIVLSDGNDTKVKELLLKFYSDELARLKKEFEEL